MLSGSNSDSNSQYHGYPKLRIAVFAYLPPAFGPAWVRLHFLSACACSSASRHAARTTSPCCWGGYVAVRKQMRFMRQNSNASARLSVTERPPVFWPTLRVSFRQNDPPSISVLRPNSQLCSTTKVGCCLIEPRIWISIIPSQTPRVRRCTNTSRTVREQYPPSMPTRASRACDFSALRSATFQTAPAREANRWLVSDLELVHLWTKTAHLGFCSRRTEAAQASSLRGI